MSAAVKPKRLKPAVRAKQLNWGERLDILDALALVLDGIYAHLPLKRSLYGFDILRGIEQLKLQLHTMSDLQFHRVLTTMMNRLREVATHRGVQVGQGRSQLAAFNNLLAFPLHKATPTGEVSFLPIPTGLAKGQRAMTTTGIGIDRASELAPKDFERLAKYHAARSPWRRARRE